MEKLDYFAGKSSFATGAGKGVGGQSWMQDESEGHGRWNLFTRCTIDLQGSLVKGLSKSIFIGTSKIVNYP